MGTQGEQQDEDAGDGHGDSEWGVPFASLYKLISIPFVHVSERHSHREDSGGHLKYEHRRPDLLSMHPVVGQIYREVLCVNMSAGVRPTALYECGSTGNGGRIRRDCR